VFGSHPLNIRAEDQTRGWPAGIHRAQLKGMKVQVDVVRTIGDQRGLVFEPVGPEQLQGQRNVHVVLTEPGQVRGNHYHRLGTEVLVVMGPALVRWKEDGELRDHEVPSGAVHRFLLPPLTPHAIKNTGNAPILMLGFNTVGHDPDQPDTCREVLI